MTVCKGTPPNLANPFYSDSCIIHANVLTHIPWCSADISLVRSTADTVVWTSIQTTLESMIEENDFGMGDH